MPPRSRAAIQISNPVPPQHHSRRTIATNTTTATTAASTAVRSRASAATATSRPPVRRTDRTVGTKVRHSLAADRALLGGEEGEDALWQGSRRFNGASVRRQLHQKSSRSGGGVSFIRSLRLSMRPPAARASKLEYNGGLISTRHPNNQALSGSVLSTTRNELDPRTAALKEQQRLLSMRCEASRSMRRERGMMDWLMDDPMTAAAAMKATTMTGRASLLRRLLFGGRNNRLQKNNLKLMEEQMEEKEAQEQDPLHLVLKEEEKGTIIKVPPKKQKRWRLWLPHQKDPIELLHPSCSPSMDSYEDSFIQAYHNPQPPADVQLKQQLANAQKQKCSERGNRHLEDHLEDASDDGSYQETRDSYASTRSSRFGVHSNEPLLMRHPRVCLKKVSNISHDEDEHTVDRGVGRKSKRNSSVTFVPQQVRTRKPNSRGSMLVQQISGLSLETARSFGGKNDDTTRSQELSITGIFDDEDDNDSNNYYTVQQLLDENRDEYWAANFNTSVVRRRTLMPDQDHGDDIPSTIFESLPPQLPQPPQPTSAATATATTSPKQQLEPEGSRLHYWFEDEEGLVDDPTEGLQQQQQAEVFRGHHYHSSFTSPPPQRPTPEYIPPFQSHHQPYHSDHTLGAVFSTTSYMEKQAGLVRLECLEEEVEEDFTESEVNGQGDDPYGLLQRKSSASVPRKESLTENGTRHVELITKTSSATALKGSLTSHSGRDSSFTSHSGNDNLNGSDSSLDFKHINHEHEKPLPKTDAFHHSYPGRRRKTVPHAGLGPRQNAVRGGVLSQHLEDETDSDREDPMHPQADPLRGPPSYLQAKPRPERKEYLPSNQDNLRGPPSYLQQEKPRRARRQVSSPEPRRSRHPVMLKEEDVGQELLREHFPPPSAATVSISPANSCDPPVEEKEAAEMSLAKPSALRAESKKSSTSSSSGESLAQRPRRIDARKCSVSSCDPPGTVASEEQLGIDHNVELVWEWSHSSDRNEEQEIHDSVHRQPQLFVVWDENDDQKDPIVMDVQQLLAAAHSEGSMDDDVSDTRSVMSEPAHMGMFEDSFRTDEDIMNDPDKNRWLYAWDDMEL